MRSDAMKGLWCVWLLALLAGSPSAVADEQTVMEVRLWAATEARAHYEVELLREILERTADRYPEYQLETVTRHMSSRRGRVEVARGERINVYVSSLRKDYLTETGQLRIVRQPIMDGLLGYRAIIIRRDFQEAFNRALAEDRLETLTVGQGVDWEDATILRHNGFTVSDSGEYQNLLPMLAHERFDTVFLGMIEAAPEISARGLGDTLMIDERKIIYYPHAMVFHVSQHEPLLAERIEVGLAELVEDGTQRALMEKHFGEALAQIRRADGNIRVLDHPSSEWLPELAEPLLARGEPPKKTP